MDSAESLVLDLRLTCNTTKIAEVISAGRHRQVADFPRLATFVACSRARRPHEAGQVPNMRGRI